MAPSTAPLNAPLAALFALRDRPDAAETTLASPEALHAARSDEGSLRIVIELASSAQRAWAGFEEAR